jgi:threonine dehydrogenase-like Zn-dependent dehydrogenase
VQVRTCLSAISPGSELLVYRGLAPDDLPVDDTLSTLGGNFSFPIKYGYAAVGEVESLGAGVDASWLGRRVFAFQPHENFFNAKVESLLPLPGDMPAEEAVFLPNMETAVTLVQDGAPLVGEQVVVFGQGVVGLLTTALLARFPLGKLITVDRYPLRRQAAQSLGATICLDPEQADFLDQLGSALDARRRYDGADLLFELSGSPQALNLAIAAAAFDSRILIGSWYGKKAAALDLGGRFHRARIRLISSQVSSLAPHLTGRWTKSRRLQVAWETLRIIKPAQLITHRFPQSQAAEAYRLLDTHPDDTIQVVLTY